ncbi:TPA: class A beta-lactamase-related serine hydrolase [Candidatus Poribacteria bacterium]|nr:class A beta-lactamase-related serine hydrolase [Candidatus Poribacteria bacterium]
MRLETVSPETVGLSRHRLTRIRPVMQSYIDDEKVVGFITLIYRRGHVAHLEKFGCKDDVHPMEFNTIFRIYSMTKPITSVAIMMLYEEGHFQLDDPVSRFIPEFKDMEVLDSVEDSQAKTVPAEREMTVRDLLRHTSGLTYDFSGGPVAEMYQKADLYNVESLAEAVKRLAEIPLMCQPGEVWNYGFSTDVLGYLVEVIAGQPFDSFLQDRIFDPLQMVDTGFDAWPEKTDRYAALYRATEDGKYEVATNSIIDRLDARAKSRKICSGGGGLLSTISDYLRFCQMLLSNGELDGERLLSRKTIEMMTCDHLSGNMHPFGQHGVGFGLGFSVVTDLAQSGILGSEGIYRWGGAASTTFWVDPKEELIAILMTQLLGNHHPFLSQFRVLTYQAIVD